MVCRTINMAGIKPAATVTKASPAYFLFIVLFLISIVSVYIQEQLLSSHHHRARQHPHSSSTRNIAKHHHDANFASPSSSRKLSLSATNEVLYPKDAIGSAKILLAAAQTSPRPIPDDIIDHHVERARCSRYKLNYTPNTPRRRIFWGANIADDSWHILSIQAIETYGIFHTAAFVESNRTSMADERTLRFDDGSLNKNILMGGMFGEDTKVTVDNYVNEDVGEGIDTMVSLPREHAQRALIIERWKKNGMTKHDIGYLSDTDELFSRDFLRAMQICDVPQFTSSGKDGHNHCAAPKVYGLVTIFEGFPECVSAEEIYHPALIIGECIEGIGDQDSDLYPKPTRDGNLTTQWRTADYTFDTYFSALHDKDNPPPPKTLPTNVYFPLWNAADYRRHSGGYFYGDDNLPLYIGYHVHNFFDDMSVLRKKYLTYGHAIGDALTKPLSSMNREVNLMIRCAKQNRTYELEGSVIYKYKSNDERRKAPIHMRKGGLDFLRRANHGKETGIGAIPMAFQIDGYMKARQKEIVDSVEKDERERLEAIAMMH